MTTQELANARLLIVDDEDTNIALLQDILQSAGFTQVRGLTDPRQVLAVADDFQPDLILLDLMMPYLDGLGVMEQLKAHLPEGTYLPVLVLTADVTAAARKRALAAGAKDFLTKPFDENEVLLRIGNLLETRFLYLRQQEQAQRRIRELLELIDQAHDAIIVRDLSGRILHWNKGAERLYGWTAAEVCSLEAGPLAVTILDQPAGPEAPQALALVREKGGWQGELRQTTKAGRELVVASRWTLARAAADQPPEVLVINTDVTENKNLEAQLLRTQRLESIGVLAGGIAHDLNNVLTPIMMGVQLLGMKAKDQTSQTLLHSLEASVQRGADMVKQILTFARGSQSQRQPLQLETVIKELGKMIRQSFPRNIEVKTAVPRDLWPVCADSTQLYQVLMNLCVNARDAMPRGGLLAVAGENLRLDAQYAAQETGVHAGPYVLLQVTDSGTGMPPEILQRIFEPFFTTKEQGKGTGLGLPVSYGIVKDHGGFMKVESKAGQGTTFKIYLPAQETAASQQAEVQPDDLPTGRGELILVVDDEAAVTSITRTTLEAYGYRVLTAADGAEAVGLYSQHIPDVKVVLTDMVMPVMDGPATIRALRHVNPAVKIIAVSGASSGGTTTEQAGLGEKAFLRKPFTAEKLLRTLRLVLLE